MTEGTLQLRSHVCIWNNARKFKTGNSKQCFERNIVIRVDQSEQQNSKFVWCVEGLKIKTIFEFEEVVKIFVWWKENDKLWNNNDYHRIYFGIVKCLPLRPGKKHRYFQIDIWRESKIGKRLPSLELYNLILGWNWNMSAKDYWQCEDGSNPQRCFNGGARRRAFSRSWIKR